MKIIGAALLAGGFGLGWMVLMYGWGLTPVSWPWIIFGTIGAVIVTGMAQVLLAWKD